jgi:hypothetical protein
MSVMSSSPSLLHFEDAGRDAAIAGVNLRS